MTSLVIAQWNILDGGRGRRDGTTDPDYDRMPAIAAELASLHADVIVLNEIRDRRGYISKGGKKHPNDAPYPLQADIDRLTRLADQLGITLAGTTPTRSGIPSAVLYRKDLLGQAKWDIAHEYLFTNGFGIAVFTPDWLPQPLAVGAVHIGPWSTEQIKGETQAANSRLSEYYTHAILAGDFNSLPSYRPDINVLALKPHHRAIHLTQGQSDHAPRPNTDADDRLIRAGYYDVAERTKACEPLPGETDEALIERTRTGHAARIDRIYVSGHLRDCPQSYSRFGFPELSNHYGIVSRIDLARASSTDPLLQDRALHHD